MKATLRKTKDSYKIDMTSSIQSFCDRLEVVEIVVLPILSVQENYRIAVADHHAQIQALWPHVDDLEDRHQ